MQRKVFFDYIEEYLNVFSTRIKRRGKLNLLELHNHAEEFYKYLLKKIYGWETRNLNSEVTNYEAIDLICDKEKYVIQISATCDKPKIENGLKKDQIKDYKEYRYKFISIAVDADKERKKKFSNPFNLKFDPIDDILDVPTILKVVKGWDIDKQEELYEFLKKELSSLNTSVHLESNLAHIVNVLSEDDLQNGLEVNTDSFEIARKIEFNNLTKGGMVIEDYSAYHPKLDNIYTTFDQQGKNKSNSVLRKIRGFYINNIDIKKEDELFFKVIEESKNKVQSSNNYTPIPEEELDMCINIIVVDAFIRCKIFKNPKGYKYATTR